MEHPQLLPYLLVLVLNLPYFGIIHVNLVVIDLSEDLVLIPLHHALFRFPQKELGSFLVVIEGKLLNPDAFAMRVEDGFSFGETLVSAK